MKVTSFIWCHGVVCFHFSTYLISIIYVLVQFLLCCVIICFYDFFFSGIQASDGNANTESGPSHLQRLFEDMKMSNQQFHALGTSESSLLPDVAINSYQSLLDFFVFFYSHGLQISIYIYIYM